jgi:hypothetical protein
MPGTTHTLYMHTLDGKPASFRRTPGLGAYLYFIGGRYKAQLRASLSEIRREWGECLDTYEAEHPGEHAAVNAQYERYGYVLVEVPR